MNIHCNGLARGLFAALVSLLLWSAPALAQTGTIAGVLVDSETGETLIGANAVIQGAATGAATDIDGKYVIRNLEPSTYTVVFSYIGYNQKTVQGVEVQAGETTRLDLSLSPEAVEVGEVIVEAEALRNTEAALLRDRQKASGVSDAISAEAISRSGSSNAADAMEKVTGASVVGGKYVYVRGLGERYSSTQLNGVDLPSADPDKKSVQFDLFPANLLDNIVTLKTFTPDRPGNFSGGLVDIGTKSFPELFNLTFSASTSLNTQTHAGSDFLTYPGGRLNFLSNGNHSLPALFDDPNVVIPNEVEARIAALGGDTEKAEMLDAASKAFNPIMAPSIGTAPLNQSYAFSLGNQSPVFNSPLGYLLSLTYNRSSSFYEDGFTGRYSLSDIDATELNPELLMEDAKGMAEVSAGGLLNLAYKLTPNHELSVNSMYTRSVETSSRFQEGSWPKEFARDDSTTLFQNRVLQTIERDLYSLQLHGKHYLKGLRGTTVEWKASGAETTQEEPDLRFFASLRRIVQDDTVYAARHSGFADPSRYYRDLDEGNRSANLDVIIPFKQWASLSANVKVGGAYRFIDRDFSERIFAITPNLSFDNNPEAYFSNENMGIVSVDTLIGGRLRYNFGNVVTDRSKPRNNYTGEQTIGAAYAMIELPLMRRLKVIGGARLETTDLEVVSEDSTQGTGRLDNNDLLPSVNLVYQVQNNMNLRAAFTRTLARPTFREIAPFESFEFINGSFFIGNPNLKRTLITNVDLRWEWFTRPGEILAVSAFYKKLENPIELTILGGTNGQTQYRNVDEALVLGAEFEVRQQLEKVHKTLKNFSSGVNLSLTHSQIDVPQTELEVRRAIDPDADDTRQLQGQSPLLLNADVTYENFQSGTTAGVFFNVFASRLARVSKGGTPDVFERPSPQFDLTFSQRLLNDWKVKFSAKNLLDAAFEETYAFRGEEFTYQRYNRGRSFSFGVTYSL